MKRSLFRDSFYDCRLEINDVLSLLGDFVGEDESSGESPDESSDGSSDDIIITRVDPPKDVLVTHVEQSRDVFIDQRTDDTASDTEEEERYMTIHHHTSASSSLMPVSLTQESISTTCPYTKRPMTDPVRNIHCGHNYDRKAIEHHIQTSTNPRCPIGGCKDNRRLCNSDLRTNEVLKSYIEEHMPPTKRRRH